MDELEVERWFDSYLEEFAAVGRGDVEDVRRLLEYYGVPLLVGTDTGCPALEDESQVLAFARQQVGSLRSADYDRSDRLTAETTVLNGSCAVHEGRFSRLRADGSEIARITCTYLITKGPGGHRISAIVVHSGSPTHAD
ncbi:hypothetical protein SAMN06893096_105152 [Geodermatophilus pulveris]|uniref:DUF6841 domain-containing protein n=1 Tax=Geodermatophilus pulveris TaxID=1564159 RepID=A0A239FL94_9ACTN|nr:hypothetical protein [Geodermatophilus pulveris]SNS57696.1 hypothetical protein SAMN06893096_105152 [Geodermatophilus pulveris]